MTAYSNTLVIDSNWLPSLCLLVGFLKVLTLVRLLYYYVFIKRKCMVVISEVVVGVFFFLDKDYEKDHESLILSRCGKETSKDFTSICFLSTLVWSEINAGVRWGNSSAGQSHQPKGASYDGGCRQAALCHLNSGTSWEPVSMSEM